MSINLQDIFFAGTWCLYRCKNDCGFELFSNHGVKQDVKCSDCNSTADIVLVEDYTSANFKYICVQELKNANMNYLANIIEALYENLKVKFRNEDALIQVMKSLTLDIMQMIDYEGEKGSGNSYY